MFKLGVSLVRVRLGFLILRGLVQCGEGVV